MKFILPFALILLAASPGCEKLRKLAEHRKPKEPAPKVLPPHLGPLVTELSDGDYETFLQQKDRLLLVDFHADWCGPCKKLAPMLDKIAGERKGLVLVGKVNVDRCEETASRQIVKAIPDVRFYRDGKMIDQFVGVPAEAEVRQMVDKHTKGLAIQEFAAPKSAMPQPMKKDWMPQGVQRR